MFLHVDDLIFIGSNPNMFDEFKKEMTKEFKMINIGIMSYYLGIEVKQKYKGNLITQEGYPIEVLTKFKMNGSNPVGTPMEYEIKLSKHEEGNKVDPNLYKLLVRSLYYLTCRRPDILYTVGVVSWYMENLTITHLKGGKRILRYLKGITNFSLYYSISHDYKLVGYNNSDYNGDMDDCKSTIGFVFYMGDILHLDIKEADDCHSFRMRGRVCSCYLMCLPCILDF